MKNDSFVYELKNERDSVKYLSIKEREQLVSDLINANRGRDAILVLKTLNRVLTEKEAGVILENLDNKGKFDYEFSLFIIEKFPKEELKQIFFKNCLRLSGPAKSYLNKAIDMLGSHSPVVLRAMFPVYLREGKFGKAKEAKEVLGEKFKPEEIKRIFRVMLENQDTEEINKFFDSEFATDKYAKLFVSKYNGSFLGAT